MTSIDIHAAYPPQFLSSRSFSVPSNAAVFEQGGYLLTNLSIEHSSTPPFHTLTELLAVINAYQDRIEVLRCEGEVDGITLNGSSEEDFYLFVKSAPFTRRASLVLIDNGNLRAVWRSDDGSQLGVQFRGGQAASYVIFKPRSSTPDVSRVSGTDTLDGVKRQIHAFGLETLLDA